MLRVRFHANLDDWRPIRFPPPGPYWCSGEGFDYAIIVAYLETESQITEFWPEATEIDIMDEDAPVTFTDRFSKPDWWSPGP